MRTCPNCQRFLGSETLFCGHCGASLSSNDASVSHNQGDDFHFDFSGTSGSSTSLGRGRDSGTWGAGQVFPSQKQGISGALAPRWKRLAGYALDFLLALLTLGIGWWIWFLIIAGSGQTPAKQLLKTRVIHAFGSGATWIVTVSRYMALSLPGWIFAVVNVFGLISLPYSLLVFVNILNAAIWLLPLVDAVFIFGPSQQRLVDKVFKTQVVEL